MLRVVYEWRVEEANIPAFRAAWKRATTRIHESVAGARGSFLVQKHGDPGSILTIARWDSYEEWQAFWRSADPAPMREMRALGERITVTPYEEFDDVTV